MTTMVAGIDAGRRTLDIHGNGFRRVGRLLGEGRHGGHGSHAPGAAAIAVRQGFRRPSRKPRQTRDLPKAASVPGRTDRVDAGIPPTFGAAFPDLRTTAPRKNCGKAGFELDSRHGCSPS